MSLFRKVVTSYWRDTTDEDFSPDEKLLYIYLLTNSSTSYCGIYRISKKTIIFETSMSENAVDKAMRSLVEREKVFVDKEHQEIFIRNWHKYYGISTKTLEVRVMRELASIKSETLPEIRKNVINGQKFSVSRETVDPVHPRATATDVIEGLKNDSGKRKVPYEEIIAHLAKATGVGFRPTTEAYRKKIRARWNDGMRLDDFIAVIDYKWKEWKGEDKSRAWCTPETLFGEKMPTYLAAAGPRKRPAANSSTEHCPVCGAVHTSTNVSTCNKCQFDMALAKDSDKVASYKQEMIAAGFGERLGIK